MIIIKQSKLTSYFAEFIPDIYPRELELKKANDLDTSASFLDLNLTIANNIISTSVYDKSDDFNFQIVNFPDLSGDVPRETSRDVRAVFENCVIGKITLRNELASENYKFGIKII